MEKKIGIFLIGLAAYGTLFAQSAYDDLLKNVYNHTVPQIRVDGLKKKIRDNEKLILLDTRSQEEYAVSHLPGAKFLDYDKFKSDDVSSLNRNQEIVVYCTVGARSEKIGERLLEMGFAKVENLYGGIFQWVNEDGAIVNNRNQPTDSVHTYSWIWGRWLKKGIKVR